MNRFLQRCLTPALVMASPACFAQDTNTLALHTGLPDMGVSVIRMMAALAFVLAIFFGGVWLYRNGQRLAWRKTGAPRLAVLESRTLGNRQAIYVVGYEQQRLLIGSSSAGLSLLAQLPPAETPAATPPGSFSQTLQNVMERK
jgi:flagellar biogenesis protein FliO